MDTTRLLPPKEAEQKLIDLGYIRLPAGSYFTWVLKDRLEAYKAVLSFKHGMWIPRTDKLQELNLLDDAFKDKDWKEYGAEKHAKEEADSLVQAPVQEEIYVNGAGDPMPF